MCEDLLELSRDFVGGNTHCLTFNEQECSASPICPSWEGKTLSWMSKLLMCGYSNLNYSKVRVRLVCGRELVAP